MELVPFDERDWFFRFVNSVRGDCDFLLRRGLAVVLNGLAAAVAAKLF
jgi:hypothetical protein